MLKEYTIDTFETQRYFVEVESTSIQRTNREDTTNTNTDQSSTAIL